MQLRPRDEQMGGERSISLDGANDVQELTRWGLGVCSPVSLDALPEDEPRDAVRRDDKTYCQTSISRQ